MTHKILDKVLILASTAAAIVLIYGDVTAVHVAGFLLSVIAITSDDISRYRHTNIMAGIATIIAACINPTFVYAIPSAVYSNIYIRRKENFACIGALAITLFARSGSSKEAAVLVFLSLFAGYLGFKTSYYMGKLNDSVSRYDDARREAQQNALKRREAYAKAENEVYTARLKERNRIAREIHDNVGHQITRVIVQMQALKIINKDENVGKQLDSVSETLDLAMTGIRRSVHELHDDSIDLAIGINDIAKTLPERFTTDVSTSIESPADNSTKTAILGIIKEAVTNIAKHSDGDKVRIEVVENISFWRVNVHDNGVCPQKEYSLSSVETSDGHGIGLSNIFDRASGMGGRCSIRSGSDGFDVLVTIPKKESKS